MSVYLAVSGLSWGTLLPLASLGISQHGTRLPLASLGISQHGTRTLQWRQAGSGPAASSSSAQAASGLSHSGPRGVLVPRPESEPTKPTLHCKAVFSTTGPPGNPRKYFKEKKLRSWEMFKVRQVGSGRAQIWTRNLITGVPVLS